MSTRAQRRSPSSWEHAYHKCRGHCPQREGSGTLMPCRPTSNLEYLRERQPKQPLQDRGKGALPWDEGDTESETQIANVKLVPEVPKSSSTQTRQGTQQKSGTKALPRRSQLAKDWKGSQESGPKLSQTAGLWTAGRSKGAPSPAAGTLAPASGAQKPCRGRWRCSGSCRGRQGRQS